MEKTITYYFDKSSDIVSLYRHDRTSDKELANGFGESIGMFVRMLVNEIDSLLNNETISITVKKEI